MDIQRLAQRWLEDFDRRQPGALFADPLDLTIAEAYAVQFEVARLREGRGEPVAGYKIGCISPAVQAQLGIDRPVFGHIFASERRYSPAVLDPARYQNLAIEGELALYAGQPSQPFPVIELHNYVFRGPTATAVELIAGNAMQAGVVLPANPSDASAATHVLEVRIDGELRGRVTAPQHHDALALLVHHLSQQGRTLSPNHLVLLGSPLPLYPVANGARVEVSSSARATAKVTANLLQPRTS